MYWLPLCRPLDNESKSILVVAHSVTMSPTCDLNSPYTPWGNLEVSSERKLKLDGVGPVDTRPSTDKLHHFVQKKNKKNNNKKKMWHMTCDTWHVTRDTWHVTRGKWHVTHDMWHVTRFGGWTFSQNFSSLAHTVCDLWYYEDLEEKDDSLSESISDEAVYRTAPATQGLLVIMIGPFLSSWTGCLYSFRPSIQSML